MSYCKYCDSSIVWVDKKPHNADGTRHDYEFCQNLKKQRKLAYRQSVVERHRPMALRIIQENHEMTIQRNWKQPNEETHGSTFRYARGNQPIVVELLEGKSKVDWATEFVGVLKNGGKCRVHFMEKSGNCWASCVVNPFNKLKKHMLDYIEAEAEVNQ
jgi:hypothetical protein